MPSAVQLVLSFIASLPPGTNIYAALIPFVQAQASSCNPRWMSIVLMVMMIPTFYIAVSALLIVRSHMRRGEFRFVKIQPSGLISVDRFLVEAFGGFTYGIISVIDMSSQLYTDYNRRPVPGKILTFWLRFPIAFFALWCVMFNCIGTHIRRAYDPTCTGDANPGSHPMPRWVVYSLNTIFMIMSSVFLLVYPAVAIPSYLLETEILNNLDAVIDHLRVASLAPGATEFSLSKLIKILQPLASASSLVDKLAKSVLSAFYFFEVIDVAVSVTYILFVYLTYRQFEEMKRSQQAIQAHQSSNSPMRIDYRAELKALYIEAIVLLIMLCAFQPMFAWAVNTRSSKELVKSQATVMVPELTLGLIACFVGPCVATYRYISARKLLAIKVNGQAQRVKPTTLQVELELNETSSKSSDPAKIRLSQQVPTSKLHHLDPDSNDDSPPVDSPLKFVPFDDQLQHDLSEKQARRDSEESTTPKL